MVPDSLDLCSPWWMLVNMCFLRQYDLFLIVWVSSRGCLVESLLHCILNIKESQSATLNFEALILMAYRFEPDSGWGRASMEALGLGEMFASLVEVWSKWLALVESFFHIFCLDCGVTNSPMFIWLLAHQSTTLGVCLAYSGHLMTYLVAGMLRTILHLGMHRRSIDLGESAEADDHYSWEEDLYFEAGAWGTDSGQAMGYEIEVICSLEGQTTEIPAPASALGYGAERVAKEVRWFIAWSDSYGERSTVGSSRAEWCHPLKQHKIFGLSSHGQFDQM